MRSTKVLPLLTVFVAALPAQWNAPPTTVNPTQRRAGAMAYHPASNRLIMYGGLSSTPSQALSDTWAFTTDWTQLTPPGGAQPRWGHQMVTNTATGNLVSFGGRSPTISSLSNDTVEWNGTTWNTVATANAPSPRFLYGMVYDTARNVVVLFGGRGNAGPNNETWEYNGTTWTQRATLNSPPAREEMGMIYDASLNQTIMFGGCNESTGAIFGDTWVYNGNDWVEVTPSTSPSPRFRGIMEYDSRRSRAVYFGGFDGSQQLTETFEYSNGEWVMVATGATIPTSTTEMTSGYDPVRKKLTMFGGFGTTFNNDTWQYTGDASGLFTTFGLGCDTGSGLIGLSGTTPDISTTLTLTFSNLGASPAVLVVLGLSSPPPVDLGFIGLFGCNLYTSPDLLDVVLATTGTATYAVPLPNQVNLVNQSLYCQGVVINFLPALTFEGTSKGGRALIGQ